MTTKPLLRNITVTLHHVLLLNLRCDFLKISHINDVKALDEIFWYSRT